MALSHSIAHPFLSQIVDEPFKEYAAFKIDVRMIRAIGVDVGSARKAIPDVAKMFSFVGDGTASEVCRGPRNESQQAHTRQRGGWC